MTSAALRLSTPLRMATTRASAARISLITPITRRHASQNESWRHREPVESSSNSESTADLRVNADGYAKGSAKGITGGGKPLDSSSPNAPPPPKVDNSSIPGSGAKLNEEQQREVDEHNRDFDSKHDRGHSAPDDKVDTKFWKSKETK